MGDETRIAAMKTTALGVGLLVLAGCSGELAVAPPAELRDCRPESYAALEDMGIPRSRVESVFSITERELVRRQPDDEEERIVGYSNWVGLEGCTGSVRLKFDRGCRLQQAYSTGNCQIPAEAD